MNSRLLKTLLLAGVIIGGIWMLSKRDEIRQPGDVVKLVKQQFSTLPAGYLLPESSPSTDATSDATLRAGERSSPQFVSNVIRIASFELNPEISSAGTNESLVTMAQICRRYDVVAVRSYGSGGSEWLAKLTDQINRGSGSEPGTSGSVNRTLFEFVFICDGMNSPMGARPTGGTSSAILFNRRTVNLDQSQWYTVNDPDQLFSRPPLVACLRARGPSADQAFTFTLVNTCIDGASSEVEYLDDLFRAIRNDGRGEDDVLIVGDFRGQSHNSQTTRNRFRKTSVPATGSTAGLGIAEFDNLFFNPAATVEFTGRGGKFDFMRRYNLRLDDAQQISQQMPVWAEFSVVEGDSSIHARTSPLQ